MRYRIDCHPRANEILPMYKAGASMAKIAGELECSVNGVRNYLLRHGDTAGRAQRIISELTADPPVRAIVASYLASLE
jgi:hypothetical protein